MVFVFEYSDVSMVGFRVFSYLMFFVFDYCAWCLFLVLCG